MYVCMLCLQQNNIYIGHRWSMCLFSMVIEMLIIDEGCVLSTANILVSMCVFSLKILLTLVM